VPDHDSLASAAPATSMAPTINTERFIVSAQRLWL
jgi:hypothetical protein